MLYTSEALQQLIEEFSRLPGIGRKSAQRIALFVLKQPRDFSTHPLVVTEFLQRRLQRRQPGAQHARCGRRRPGLDHVDGLSVETVTGCLPVRRTQDVVIDPRCGQTPVVLG